MHEDGPLPRLASRVRVDALIRRVNSAGGFGTVLARGDDEAMPHYRRVRDEIGPRLDDATRAWLETATAPITA